MKPIAASPTCAIKCKGSGVITPPTYRAQLCREALKPKKMDGKLQMRKLIGWDCGGKR